MSTPMVTTVASTMATNIPMSQTVYDAAINNPLLKALFGDTLMVGATKPIASQYPRKRKQPERTLDSKVRRGVRRPGKRNKNQYVLESEHQTTLNTIGVDTRTTNLVTNILNAFLVYDLVNLIIDYMADKIDRVDIVERDRSYRDELSVNLFWWQSFKEWFTMLKNGIEIKKVVLVCGPPGCGKSYMVHNCFPKWMPDITVISLDSDHPKQHNYTQQIDSAKVRFHNHLLLFHLDYMWKKELKEWRLLTKYYLKAPAHTSGTFHALCPLVIECRPDELFVAGSRLAMWRKHAIVETVFVYKWTHGQLSSLLFQYIDYMRTTMKKNVFVSKPLWTTLLNNSRGDPRQLLNELDIRLECNQWKLAAGSTSGNALTRIDAQSSTSMGLIECLKLLFENYHQVRFHHLNTIFDNNPRSLMEDNVGYRLLDFSLYLDYLFKIELPTAKKVLKENDNRGEKPEHIVKVETEDVDFETFDKRFDVEPARKRTKFDTKEMRQMSNKFTLVDSRGYIVETKKKEKKHKEQSTLGSTSILPELLRDRTRKNNTLRNLYVEPPELQTTVGIQDISDSFEFISEIDLLTKFGETRLSSELLSGLESASTVNVLQKFHSRNLEDYYEQMCENPKELNIYKHFVRRLPQCSERLHINYFVSEFKLSNKRKVNPVNLITSVDVNDLEIIRK